MSVKQRGPNTFLIGVYLGRDANTGKRIEKFETFYGNKRQALARERKLYSAYSDRPKLKATGLTFWELVVVYLRAAASRLSPETLFLREAGLKTYAKSVIGNVKVGKLDQGNLEQLFSGLSARGLAPNTVHAVHELLHVVFNFAIREGILESNPLKGVMLPKKTPPRVGFLTLEESRAFIAVYQKYWYGAAFVFQLKTGLRNEELMALSWSEHVDLEKGRIVVNRACKWVRSYLRRIGPPKCPRSYRVIELSPEQVLFLREYKKRQQEWIAQRQVSGRPYQEPDLVFSTMDGRVPSDGVVRKNFKAMLRGAGIGRRLRWYDLRHTCASILLDAGEPDYAVAAMLGHSVEQLNKTYAHVLPKRMRQLSLSMEKQLAEP